MFKAQIEAIQSVAPPPPPRDDLDEEESHKDGAEGAPLVPPPPPPSPPAPYQTPAMLRQGESMITCGFLSFLTPAQMTSVR